MPAFALVLMAGMSVFMWLLSSGIRRVIGLAVVGLLCWAWHIGSWELASGAIGIAISPLVFMGLIEGWQHADSQFDARLAYFINVLIALDQLANTLIGGYPDETLSSVAYRMSLKADSHWRWRIARTVIDHIFWFEPNHCHMAFLAEVNRAQQDPAIREMAKQINPGA